MQTNKSKKTKLLITGGVLVVALSVLVTSTYLWFSSTASEENVLEMDTFTVTITEDFDPNQPVEPGLTVDKKVGVENHSNVPVAVRMRLDESLQLLELDGTGGNPKVDYKDDATLASGEIIATVSANQIAALKNSGYAEDTAAAAGLPGAVVLRRDTPKADGTGTTTEYVAYLDDGSNRLLEYTAGNPGTFKYAIFKQGTLKTGTHGLPNDSGHFDHTGIELQFDPGKQWILDESTGWYYYNELIPAGQLSGKIITGVSFAENLDNSYKGAVYILTPTIEATQGKQAAVDEMWGTGSPKSIKTVFEVNDTTGDVTVHLP